MHAHIKSLKVAREVSVFDSHLHLASTLPAHPFQMDTTLAIFWLLEIGFIMFWVLVIIEIIDGKDNAQMPMAAPAA